MKSAIILSPVNTSTKVDRYCQGCGRYLCSINREVLVISLGTEYPIQEVPRNMGWIMVQCHKCKEQANFYFN